MMSDAQEKPEKHRLRKRNYVRTCRKRCGLTQKEMGFLLECESGNTVYRYERDKQVPSLRSVFACQIILGVPGHELFTGIYNEVEEIIHNRAHQLIERLQGNSSDRKTQRKLAVINAIVSGKQNAPQQDI